VRVGLEPGDQFSQVRRRHGFPCDDDSTLAPDLRNRLEILQQVLRESVDRSVRDVRAPEAENERVTVGRRAGNSPDTDAAGSASHIFNQHGLAERDSHLLGHDPSKSIRWPAGGERNHDLGCDGKFCAAAGPIAPIAKVDTAKANSNARLVIMAPSRMVASAIVSVAMLARASSKWKPQPGRPMRR
jgi:hypothetical protein